MGVIGALVVYVCIQWHFGWYATIDILWLHFLHTNKSPANNRLRGESEAVLSAFE